MKTETSLTGNAISPPSRLWGTVAGLLIPLGVAVAFLALSPVARAVCQDGCLSNFNTALGEDALISNTTGVQNTAIGGVALRFNTTGGNNTATGLQALYSNPTGSANTATGSFALTGNT